MARFLPWTGSLVLAGWAFLGLPLESYAQANRAIFVPPAVSGYGFRPGFSISPLCLPRCSPTPRCGVPYYSWPCHYSWGSPWYRCTPYPWYSTPYPWIRTPCAPPAYGLYAASVPAARPSLTVPLAASAPAFRAAVPPVASPGAFAPPAFAASALSASLAIPDTNYQAYLAGAEASRPRSTTPVRREADEPPLGSLLVRSPITPPRTAPPAAPTPAAPRGAASRLGPWHIDNPLYRQAIPGLAE